MRFSNAIKSYFYFTLIVIAIHACDRTPVADFSKINIRRYYSGTFDSRKLFLKFEEVDKQTASGTAFADENTLSVTPGKIEISNNSIHVRLPQFEISQNGKWIIESDKLVFINNSNKKEKSTFFLQPEYTIPAFGNRYVEAVFDTIQRSEVTYGKASGFYQSKPISKMNYESYPDIISEVLNELGNNLFTDDLSLKMDIYQPKGDTVSSRPLLMLIHGGAFIVGDKRDKLQQKLAIHYAKLGYVVASINYRLGYLFIPGAYSNLERCIYRAIQDTRAAFRWLVKNNKKYRIDTNHIFVAGNSAGGFIAMKTAFMADSESFESVDGNLLMLQDDLGCLDCSGNNYKDKFRLKGVINMWGALTDIEMIDEFEKTPMLLIHGDSDNIVPYGYDYPFKNVGEEYSSFFSKKVYGSGPIFEKTSSIGFPVTLLKISGGNHEPQIDENNKYTSDLKLIHHAIDSFLNAQILRDTFNLEKTTNNEYSITPSTGIEKVFWSIEGGCITATPQLNEVRVVRFSNSSNCVLKAAVLNKNGIVFSTKIIIE
ncbi:MAG: hypothetical protein A2W93_04150 [Bacteroidetes bacterium GWF2_43_63]|nr:MAG: hypothetical protein A2W94_06065 [Bacteroidetes bacterium GWE2_42_42]OFY54374.1 MAG: hypothetical protein A2W93_04150 [Bacteroidetes bacterium GWF2_43_63]HBG69236.1 hypothetical protein [Bacteroidales bacterium]HCB61208.1 hypothetical protein [Bacteroidales bacterium]HCY24128.1 hypothetical protein [Bacteroidales bacterium]